MLIPRKQIIQNKHQKYNQRAIIQKQKATPIVCDILSVGSQNVITLILPKQLFVNAGIPNVWLTFSQTLLALDQLEPPLKASIMLQNIVSMKDTIVLVLILPRYNVLP